MPGSRFALAEGAESRRLPKSYKSRQGMRIWHVFEEARSILGPQITTRLGPAAVVQT